MTTFRLRVFECNLRVFKCNLRVFKCTLRVLIFINATVQLTVTDVFLSGKKYAVGNHFFLLKIY